MVCIFLLQLPVLTFVIRIFFFTLLLQAVVTPLPADFRGGGQSPLVVSFENNFIFCFFVSQVLLSCIPGTGNVNVVRIQHYIFCDMPLVLLVLLLSKKLTWFGPFSLEQHLKCQFSYFILERMFGFSLHM
jgi:hypothetical protein